MVYFKRLHGWEEIADRTCMLHPITLILVLGKFGLVRSGAIFAGSETGWTRVQSLMQFLGPGPGPPGTIYIGLVWVQTRSRLGPDKICTILLTVAQNPWVNGEGLRAGV